MAKSTSPCLTIPREIILHHHERFDGKGYPDGLSGIDIPMGARIISICDSGLIYFLL